MGYTEWTEQVEEVVGTDANGNPVTATVTVEYYEITCDNCGKVVTNTKTKEGIGSGYYKVGDKYYCDNCYRVLKATGGL